MKQLVEFLIDQLYRGEHEKGDKIEIDKRSAEVLKERGIVKFVKPKKEVKNVK